MSRLPHVDESPVAEATPRAALAPIDDPQQPQVPRPAKRLRRPIYRSLPMTAFVTSCVETVSGSAAAAERRARGRPRARRLLKLLEGKRNILVTTHEHPDPDALASIQGLRRLLEIKLPAGTRVTTSIKGRMGGGVNDIFVKHSNFDLLPWDESKIGDYDAILLLDTQPLFAYSPLPAGTRPLAIIDHHRGRGRPSGGGFCDVRTDVGATASIVFSYYLELDVPIDPSLAATLLYAIETDLAGAAGTPGELDNIALSQLTLIADTRKLYQMRYAPLPQSHYLAFHEGLENTLFWEGALMSHLAHVDSLEKPALIADFLLRFDKARWALVTGVYENKLLLSLRTETTSTLAAADMMKRLIRGIGDGGGHRTKAGGFIRLQTGSEAEVEKIRKTIRRRYLRSLRIKQARGTRLVPQG
jgi:nanoRNase/pAp phosphatase (c-di-AMP/oligoRNAs hydrolase)